MRIWYVSLRDSLRPVLTNRLLWVSDSGIQLPPVVSAGVLSGLDESWGKDRIGGVG